MIVIIEGEDGTGKSTLARELEDRLDIAVMKQTGTPLKGQSVQESQRQDYALAEVFALTGTDIIMDRFFPSEYAYGEVFDRPYDSALLWKTDELISSIDHLAIRLFHRDRDAYEARQIDDDLSADDAMRVSKMYTEYIGKSRMEWIEADAALPTNILIESTMRTLIDMRPSRDDVYMQLAATVAERSTCLSRRVGAVLLSWDGHVIATGYNGAPTGCPVQGECVRLRDGSASGTHLDSCEDVHAEENCLIQAGLNGSTPRGGTLYTLYSPCSRCMRQIVNAKIEEVVYCYEYGDTNALSKKYGVDVRHLDEPSRRS